MFFDFYPKDYLDCIFSFRLSDLQAISVNEHGAVNELELALGRGAGIFDDGTAVFARKYFDKFICRKHLDELVRKWGQVRSFL